MKLKQCFVGAAIAACMLTTANALVTINLSVGTALLANGTTPVPDGTLWVVVLDTNSSSSLPAMTLNSSIFETAQTTVGLASVNSTFATGQNIALGTLIGGDAVFGIGGFSSGLAGFAGGAAPALADLTLPAGRNYGFYFFPGVTFTTEAATYQVGGSVGGIHTGVDDGPIGAMVVPPDGNLVDSGANSVSVGGSIANSRFTAVTLIPEPSAALLGAVGVLGLLRRRRN